VTAVRTAIVRSDPITVSYEVMNGWTVLEVDGEVDVYTHAGMREAVDRLLGEGHRCFVLDLCPASFLDSMGLGAVVAITRRIRALAGSLRIACPSPQLLRLFECGGLRDVYEFYDSPQEAARQAPASDGSDGLAGRPGTRPSSA